MDPKTFYDVVIVGGGPAGLTAGLYLARARYRVVIVEQDHFGGQVTITHQVVNYPGVAQASGAELTETMRRQAQSFGAEFLLAQVTGLDLTGDVKTVRTTRGALSCFGVLWATGAHPRKVGFAGEAAFQGRGVAYCATCDGEFFTGKDVFVVGGGFAAAEEAVFLTKYARHVTILIRGADFSCAPSVAQAARAHERITVLPHTQVEGVEGARALEDFLPFWKGEVCAFFCRSRRRGCAGNKPPLRKGRLGGMTHPCPAGQGYAASVRDRRCLPCGQKRFRVGAPDFGLSRGKVG